MNTKAPDVIKDAEDTDRFELIVFRFDGKSKSIKKDMTLEEACNATVQTVESIPAMFGLINRIILVDQDDYINFEWTFKDGVIFPPEEDSKE